MVTVEEVIQETPSTVTMRFPYQPSALPGQFVMIWVPGDDEIPMSLSFSEGERKGVTVKAMGTTSRHITQMKPGVLLGIRGPYGNHFDLNRRHVLIVGGGSGTAVLAPAAEAAHQQGTRIDAALGATTAAEILFEERLGAISGRLEVSTDDGTAGAKGYVTNLVGPMLETGDFDAVWTCGPEIMMSKVLAAARKRDVPVFGSMERWMKCGINLCDACSLGPYHVCTDGPVFPHTVLESVPDFGRTKLTMAGVRVPA